MHFVVTLSEDASNFTVQQTEGDAKYMHPALMAMVHAKNPKACLKALVIFAHNF